MGPILLIKFRRQKDRKMHGKAVVGFLLGFLLEHQHIHLLCIGTQSDQQSVSVSLQDRLVVELIVIYFHELTFGYIL